MQAVSGLDWAEDGAAGPGGIDRLVVVHADDRDGQDALAGVELWADPGLDHPRLPFDPGEHAVAVDGPDDARSAVERIRELQPDVALLAVDGPTAARVAAGALDSAWDGVLLGTARTGSPERTEALASDRAHDRSVHVSAVPPLTGQSEAHRDMRRAAGLPADGPLPGDVDAPASTDAWVTGWISQYPLHEALREAITRGDLTRAGLADALAEAHVGYRGALPAVSYRKPPDAQAARAVFVSRPAPDAPTGREPIADGYAGPTARDHELLRPCTEAR